MSNITCYFENQKNIILKEISNAKHEILICMAWINDRDYFNALLNAKSNGIKIELITSSRNHDLNLLTESCKKFDYFGIIHLPYLSIMHKKYCIIDESIILTGSYNWTHNAEYYNFENLLKIIDPNVAYQFKNDFLETKVFSKNTFILPKRCSCGGNLINILCIENEDYNLQGECYIYYICLKCGETEFVTNDFEFNILNTLTSDTSSYYDVLRFLNYHAENNFELKIHAIAVATIDPISLYKTYRVIYKNKYFKRYIEDYYDF